MKFVGSTVVKGKEVQTFKKINHKSVAALCLGYREEDSIYKCLEAFDMEGFKGPKLLLDLGFPGNSPLKFKGWDVERVRNQGTAKNWDVGYAMLKCPNKVVGVEPDELPDFGWSKAVLKVLDDPTVALATLCMKTHHPKYIEHFNLQIKNINGVNCVEFPLGSPTPWPASAISSRILKHGMDAYEFYGSLESLTQNKIYKLGQRVVHLVDFNVERLRGCESYERWKELSGDNQIKEPYEIWLKQHG